MESRKKNEEVYKIHYLAPILILAFFFGSLIKMFLYWSFYKFHQKITVDKQLASARMAFGLWINFDGLSFSAYTCLQNPILVRLEIDLEVFGFVNW